MEYQQQPQQQYYQQPQQPSYSGYDQSYQQQQQYPQQQQQQQQPVYSQYPEQQRHDAQQQQYQQYPQQQYPQQQQQQYPQTQGGYGAPQQGGYPNVQPGYVPNPAFQQPIGHGAPGTTPAKPLIYGPNYILELKALNLDRKDASGKSDPFIQVYCAKAAAAGEGGKHKEKKEKEKHQVGGLLGMVVAGVGEAIGVEVPDSLMEKVEGVEVSGGSGGSKHPSKTGKWEILYKSEVVRQNLNPHWQPFAVNLGRLCNDVNTKFLIECYDWDADGTHDFIGFCATTIHELQTMREAKFINPNRTGLSNTAGLLQVVNCKIADTAVEPFKALPSTTTTTASTTTTTSTSGTSESAHVPSTNQTPASPDINSPATSHGCCACMPHSHHK